MTEHENVGRAAPGSNRDAGSASVFAAVSAAVLLTVCALAVQLGAAMVARHRAESAADLGVLAGAAQILSGTEIACAKASVIVQAGSADMESCVQEGLDLLIVVSVPAGFLGGRAVAKARAGPV